jgi:hypothetical protein
MAYNETTMEGITMFIGLDTAAKTMVTATVLGVVTAVAVNYGMKAYDHIKAKRNEKKNQKIQTA